VNAQLSMISYQLIVLGFELGVIIGLLVMGLFWLKR